MLDLGVRRKGQLLVGFEDDASKVGGIGTTITFRSDVERCLGVLREPVQEQFEESINVFAGDGRRRHCCAVVSIRIPNINGLIKENNISVIVPAVGIEGRVMSPVGDIARSQLQQKAGR